VAELAAETQRDPDQRRGELVIVVQGASGRPAGSAFELTRVIDILLAELPLKQAVSLAARITGEPRNRVYELALTRDERSR
jgi:16S rRNA (cytidine1402-2'-O)-methyltransferase